MQSAPATGQGARKSLCNPCVATSASQRARYRSCDLTAVRRTRLHSRRPNHPTSKRNLPAVRPVSIRSPGRDTARQCAGSSREGRATGRFRPSRRVSSPLFESALLSMGRSLTPPTAPRPATNDGLRTSGPRSGGPHPHMPRHDPTAKNGTSGCRNAAVRANFGDCCMWVTVCLGEHGGERFPVPARERRRSSSRRFRAPTGRGITVRRCRARCYQARPEGPILVDAFADAAARCSLATFSACGSRPCGWPSHLARVPGGVGASRRRPLCLSGKGPNRG
jgi:hypothetical protein